MPHQVLAETDALHPEIAARQKIEKGTVKALKNFEKSFHKEKRAKPVADPQVDSPIKYKAQKIQESAEISKIPRLEKSQKESKPLTVPKREAASALPAMSRTGSLSLPHDKAPRQMPGMIQSKQYRLNEEKTQHIH
ncbi:MAG: hypothetical protein R3B71_01710 [Candidatus Gracilibacteria bacterium]